MTEEIKVESNQESGDENTAGKSAGEQTNKNEVLEGVDVADGGVKKSSGEEQKEAAGASTGASSVDFNEELNRLKKEADSMRDAWTRERAEFMNYKKRVSQEQARYRVDIIAEFAKNLLPVVDNLERVLHVENPDAALKNFISGVEMIKSEFISVLEKENIRRLNPINQGFDPFKMEAIAMEDRSDIEKDTVIEVFQPGYVYEKDENDTKVLRPARVKVAKKS